MCYPVKCEKCGKTTWAGCGKHKDMVMSKIPENERCQCPREGEPVPKEPNTASAGGDHGNVKDIQSTDEFNAAIKGDKLVVADFFATWCGPCKAMAPVFAKVSKELTDVKFIKVNGDDYEDIIEEYEISGYPTFALFKGGKLLDSKSGRMDENTLRSFIKSKM
jgi:thioredoxin 1